jgi:aminoglycoside 3-N-acetyltransferase I
MEIHCQKLQPHQSRQLAALIGLYANVFETKDFQLPATRWLEKLLQDESMIFIAAFAGEELAGGLTAYILPSVYTESCDVYLYDLAVMPALQRKGIGKKLLQELKAYCSNMGYSEIFVQAEMADDEAICFYLATGGVAQNAVHFSYSL